MENETICNLDFVNFLWNHFDYVIFDFDYTMSKEHLANNLEKDDWKNFIEKCDIQYISNPEFFKFLVNKAYNGKHVLIFSHGNNENGIIKILEKDLGKTTADRINIIAGRTIDRLREDFKDPKSLGKDQVFIYEKNKQDMFEYMKNKFNLNFTKYNTVFFEDTPRNLDTNQALGYCTRVDIFQKSDGFNIDQFPRYKEQIETQLQKYLNEEFIKKIGGYSLDDNISSKQAKKNVRKLLMIDRVSKRKRKNQ